MTSRHGAELVSTESPAPRETLRCAKSEPASRASGLSRRLRDFWFTIDLRSAGLFRVLLGCVLIGHWVSRWRWRDVLYSSEGVLPARVLGEIRDISISQTGFWPPLGWWTPLEWLDASRWAMQAFLIATLVCYAMFLVGYRTRLFGVLSLLAWSALVHRNQFDLIGADFVIGSLLLWAQFLPLSQRFSLDAVRNAVRRGVTLPPGPRSGSEPGPLTADERSGFSIGAFGVVLQIGMIYFFTGLWKTVPMLWGESTAWLDGTAIHYVLHMEQSIRTAAVWTREMPLWFIRCLSWGTLAIELAALPMFLLPWLQPLLRRVAIAMLVLLHVGIAVTLDAGMFSYVMLASYAVLLTGADWAIVGRCLSRFSRPATVYYDDGCGICTRTCEILAACDCFGRLSFIGSSEREAYRHTLPAGLVEKTVVVFDERTGRMYTRSRAAGKALRGLPLPYHLLAWFALPGLHWVSDLAYDLFAVNRHRVSGLLRLTACRVPDRSGPARSEPGKGQPAGATPRARPSPGRPGRWCNLAAGVVLACVVVANLVENGVRMEQGWRGHGYRGQFFADPAVESPLARATGPLRLLEDLVSWNESLNVVVHFSGAIQHWNMFAPDPPSMDEWWVADATLANGQRVDPMTRPGFPLSGFQDSPQQTSFLVQPSFRERRYERIWGSYLQYAPGDRRRERFRGSEVLRRELCRYLVESHDRYADEDEKIVSLDLYLIWAGMPPATRDEARLAALWPVADGRPAARVERTLAPDRVGFNPYRHGLLMASYYPRNELARRFESGAFAVSPPAPPPEPGERKSDVPAWQPETAGGPPRRMLQFIWYPSGTRFGKGPFDLDWVAVVGDWTEEVPGSTLQGKYVRGDWPGGPSLREGAWRVEDQNGDLQAQGKYQRGRREGIWHAFYPHDAGLREEATYRADRREGAVTRWYPGYRAQLKKEAGQYRDDQPDGEWTYWDSLGYKLRSGQFQNGLQEGRWTTFHRNQKPARVEHYRGGVLEGPCAEFLPNGQLAEQGQHSGGLRTGVWKTYYPLTDPGAEDEKPRQRREATYVEGNLEGTVTEYYESGAVLERAKYAANQRHGPLMRLYPSGKPREQGEFRDGQQQGRWTQWYENGQVSLEGAYQDGLQQGEWKTYWEYGKPMTVGTFVDGAPHGAWSIYYRSGKPDKRGQYAQGLQSGHWESWNEDGSKAAEGDYSAGRKVGVWTTWVDGKAVQQKFEDPPGP